jgi:hypothetical protein
MGSIGLMSDYDFRADIYSGELRTSGHMMEERAFVGPCLTREAETGFWDSGPPLVATRLNHSTGYDRGNQSHYTRPSKAT